MIDIGPNLTEIIEAALFLAFVLGLFWLFVRTGK